MRPELLDYVNKILEWALERDIISLQNANTRLQTQQLKFMSELGEYCDASIAGNRDEIKDALGDMFVVSCSIVFLRVIASDDITYTKAVDKTISRFSEAYIDTDRLLWHTDTVFDLAEDAGIICIGSLLTNLDRLAQLNDVDLLDCVAGAYNTIKNRRGKTLPNGNFVKEQ